MLHLHLYLHVVLIRRTKGEDRELPKKAILFQKFGGHWIWKHSSSNLRVGIGYSLRRRRGYFRNLDYFHFSRMSCMTRSTSILLFKKKKKRMNFVPGIKGPAREFAHSPPSSTKIGNEWSCTSASPLRIRGLDSDNCNCRPPFFNL